MIDRNSDIVIHKVLNEFEKGSTDIFNFIADDIDLEISHYHDEADTSWQKAKNKSEFGPLLLRLGTEVFTKGTRILKLSSLDLKQGWYLTSLKQRFYYEVKNKVVDSETFIISHEKSGKLDYFRETVKNILEECSQLNDDEL